MIAIDTTILVAAHRTSSPDYARALVAVENLASSGVSWALPWPVAHELVTVMTAIEPAPAPAETALGMLQALLATPGCTPIGERQHHARRLAALIRESGATGPLVGTARIAAICLDHGISELWTSDPDYARFPALATRNPLADE